MQTPWAKAIKDRAAQRGNGAAPMQIGGVAIPEEVLKAIAAQMSGNGGAQLPGLGAVSKQDRRLPEGFELPPARGTITLGSAARVVEARNVSQAQKKQRGCRFRALEADDNEESCNSRPPTTMLR